MAERAVWVWSLALLVCAACGDDDEREDHTLVDARVARGGSGGRDAGHSSTDDAAVPAHDGGASVDECVDAVLEALPGGQARCIQCLCETDPVATARCDADCWKLSACVALHCEQTDTDCILVNCADAAGGAGRLPELGALARGLPLTACSRSCLEQLPPSSGDF